MATQFNFNGQLIKLPGVYTQTKSGITNPSLGLSFGNVLIIDTNPNSEFGGGAGINGTLSQEKKSIYTFDNVRSFRSFIRGGKYWDLSGPLFRPFGAGINGASQVHYIRALSTVTAKNILSLVDTGNGGVFSLEAKHEGLVGNGKISDETPGTGDVTLTALGANGQTLDLLLNAISIGTYNQAPGDTLANIATALVTNINLGTNTHEWISSIDPLIPEKIILTRVNGYGDAQNGNTVVLAGTWAGTSTTNAIANGVNGNNLSQGLGYKIISSPSNPSKFLMKFYRGNFTGDAIDNIAYDGVNAANSIAELISTSVEFNTFQELKDWMDIDFDFNNNFKLTTAVIQGTGVITPTAISNYVDLSIFQGGSQTFSPSDLTQLLDTIAELDYTFVMAPDSGAQHSSSTNNAILSHLVDDARFEKFMVVAGGNDKNTFVSESIAAAKAYDTDRVIVVHGGVEVASNVAGTGLRTKSSEWKMAAVLGRVAGLEPYTPVTFKGINFAAETHPLIKREKEQALDNGVLVTAFDGDLGAFIVVQGINTLQRNRNVLNADGTSHSLQLKRIAAQLNKEIEVNAKIDLLGNQNSGPNRHTLRPVMVEEWLKAFLQRRTARATTDNLIIGFQDIKVSIIQDAYAIEYSFIPNFEINKLFFTGLIIDPNI